MEIMVQGPQIKLVTKCLIDTIRFPEKFIKTINLKKEGEKIIFKIASCLYVTLIK